MPMEKQRQRSKPEIGVFRKSRKSVPIFRFGTLAAVWVGTSLYKKLALLSFSH